MPRGTKQLTLVGYDVMLADVARVIEDARRAAVRSVNALMTATYWFVGWRIVELEQRGKARADYGEALLERLSADLTEHFGRGFSVRNLRQMRAFYTAWPNRQTLSADSETARPTKLVPRIRQTLSAESGPSSVSFSLPWSHYTRLLQVQNPLARKFYEAEALRGGWSVRQLDRQIGSKFYERTALSRKKAAMMRKGQIAKPEDIVSPEEAIKDPYVLEFLDLKDEYSETEAEEALIRHLETFLLELGGDFSFVGRQRRLRVGDTWYRVDLLFFHRRLRCLVIIDLKLGKFTHADAGQMHLYLNYAREHWTLRGENPPVGLILCAEKDHAMAKYALDGLTNKILAAEYKTALPKEQRLVEEIEKTRRQLEARGARPRRR
ncbi:YhcG family protein [Pendulispora albinea]|uniref:PDDEXK nuclease domain-containing protein n=1 Tax=Pendulispora albinea TaxID=2741071 RepID=A0ABZ2M7G6_9BACT